MIRSMTGYGKAEARLEAGTLTIEIRTLNGKNADINLKTAVIPKDKEIALRQRIAEKLQRGSIDVFVSWEANAQDSAKPINRELFKEYYRQIEEIRRELPGFDPDSSSDEIVAAILRFPDITEHKKGEIITDENWPLVESAIDRALQETVEFREREGAALYRDVTSRVAKILGIYDEIESFESERIEGVRARILRNLEDLAQKIDQTRFEQEMIFYLEKLDINEEKVRLRQHCKYFMDTIDSEECPGKKLGFIIQEMGREINTTGSKANHAGIQNCVVRMKDELEKIREQSLNIL